MAWRALSDATPVYGRRGTHIGVVERGALQDGHYAPADLRERTAELGQLSYTAPTS